MMRMHDADGQVEAYTCRTTRPAGRVTVEAGTPQDVRAPGVVLEVQGSGGSSWVWVDPATARDLADALADMAAQQGVRA